MNIIETEKGEIIQLTRGDEILFRHGQQGKLKRILDEETYFIVGKHTIECVGNNHRIILADPDIDTLFDNMGVMADINVVIATNVINGLLIFLTEENARDFLNNVRTDEVIRETVSIQHRFSQLPVQTLV